MHHTEKSVQFAPPEPSVVGTLEVAKEETDGKIQHVEDYFGIQKCKEQKGLPKCRKLKIFVTVQWQDGTSQNMEALVGTGAEVNLVNTKLVNQDLFAPAKKPVRLGVANSHLLQGGGREVTMFLSFWGHDVDTKKKVGFRTPLTAYDGEMMCDIILSYGWLAENNVLINPKRHGIIFPDNGRMIWVDGLLTKAHTNTSMVQGMPIEVLDNTPLQPSEVTGSSMSKEKYHEMVSDGKNEEKATKLVAHLMAIGLTTNQNHPRMGCPDMPGFSATKADPLTEHDVKNISQNMVQGNIEINYIK